MRKYLLLMAIFLFSSLLYSQPALREAIIVVPDKTTAFGTDINAGMIVCELDSNAFYEVTASFASTSDMGDVFTANSYDKLGDRQTIYLGGDVTGSGIFSITTTISADAVEASMLNNNVISGQTALTSGLADTDELLISDAGVLKRVDLSVVKSHMELWTDGGTYLTPADGESVRADLFESTASGSSYLNFWEDGAVLETALSGVNAIVLDAVYSSAGTEVHVNPQHKGFETIIKESEGGAEPTFRVSHDSLYVTLSSNTATDDDSIKFMALDRQFKIMTPLYLDEVYEGAAGDTTLLVLNSSDQVSWLHPSDLGISGGGGGSGDVVAGTGFGEGRVLFGGSGTNEANGDANMTFDATNRRLSIDSIAALGLRFTTTPGDGDAQAENVVMNSDGRIKTKGYTEDVMSFTAGNAFAANEIGYLRSDGKMYHTDADTDNSSAGLLGVALEGISADGTGDFMLKGIITTSGLTTGQVMYLSTTAGTWTSTAPSASEDIVRIIGACLSSTEIWFNPDWTYLEIE